ncbi:MAG: hypothetical protein E6692_09950 [Streptococcus vestibularis]|nr:hypothetical protein [Streptococcus vestibularis]MDU3179766.1 hypothetical protein [Streptococcus vestibularis]
MGQERFLSRHAFWWAKTTYRYCPWSCHES